MPSPVTWSIRGVETLGPYLWVGCPVTKASCVVATSKKPTVVEHIALDADLCGPVGEPKKLVEVMVEIDGLPYVQGHRSIGIGVVRCGAKPVVNPVGRLIEPIGVVEIDPGGLVTLHAAQCDLPREEQFASSHHLLATGASLHPCAVVCGSCNVEAPDLSAFEREARFATERHRWGVEPGAPVTPLAEPAAQVEGHALRFPFTTPTAREVQDFGCGQGSGGQ